MNSVVPLDFFDRDSFTVARELLGKQVVRRLSDGKILRFTLNEIEIYDGQHDQASHARFGCTSRSKVMFGPAGRIYVYLIYGMHWMLNVVTREKGYPAALLIRGTQELEGPGRLGKALELDQSLHGREAVPETGLWFEHSKTPLHSPEILQTPRIGIDYAGAEWREKLWRFKQKTP